MVQVISKSNFDLYELDKEVHGDFIARHHVDLSDMESFLLKLTGKCISSQGAQFFWNDGCFCWFLNFPEQGKSIEQKVWMTDNGIVIFEDCETNKLFRVSGNVPL